MTQLDIFTITQDSTVLDILLNASDWVSMSKMSVLSGLTERAVRSEIKRIRNDDSIDYVIESSSKGYRIAKSGDVSPMLLSRAVSSIKSAVAVDSSALLTFYKVLNELKKKHPALHNQIDIENGVVERYIK